MLRKNAVKARYLQMNTKNLMTFLIFDIDRQGAAFAAYDSGLPEPTFITINPKNTHAHLIYQLSAPVATSEKSHLKPQEYLEAIRRAYTKKLNADPGYTGQLTKNPVHPNWTTIYNPAMTYSLDELSDYVDLNIDKSIRHDKDSDTIGRNVTLFNRLRHWSYKAVREFWRPGQQALYRSWLKMVLLKARELNDFTDCEFTGQGQNPKKGKAAGNKPLCSPEVAAIARSVGRWTWEKMTPGGIDAYIDEKRSPEKQAARRAARTEKQRAVMEHGIEMYRNGATVGEITMECKVARRTVFRWLAQERLFQISTRECHISDMVMSPSLKVAKSELVATESTQKKGVILASDHFRSSSGDLQRGLSPPRPPNGSDYRHPGIDIDLLAMMERLVKQTRGLPPSALCPF